MKMFFGDLVLFKIVVYMNYVVIYFELSLIMGIIIMIKKYFDYGVCKIFLK